MALSIFSLTGRANPNILSERMLRQQWRKNLFGMWVAPNFVKATRNTSEVVGPQPQGDGAKFTGAPVELHKDFTKVGKTTLDIPVRVRLTGRPQFGDKALEGTEENAKITYRTVRINLTRKAYNKPSLTSAQITLPYLENLMFEAEEYLTDWWNDYHPGNFILTMLAGSSLDLQAPTVEGGRGIAILSHPHFYTAGGGKVSYSGGRPGVAGYETSVTTAINGLTNVAGDYFTIAMLQKLVAEAARLKIQPLAMKARFRRFVIWITDAQWIQLQADTDFKEFYRRLPNELEDHPLATGAQADLFGAIIYVDQNLFGARTATNPGVYADGTAASAPAANVTEYGYPPTAAERTLGYKVGVNAWVEQRDLSSDRKIGFLIGQSAMSVGQGVPVSGGKKHPVMSFIENTKDYGANQGIGVQTVQSVLRNDIFDQDGMITGLSAGDFYENTSSLVFGTFSPDSFSF